MKLQEYYTSWHHCSFCSCSLDWQIGKLTDALYIRMVHCSYVHVPVLCSPSMVSSVRNIFFFSVMVHWFLLCALCSVSSMCYRKFVSGHCINQQYCQMEMNSVTTFMHIHWQGNLFCFSTIADMGYAIIWCIWCIALEIYKLLLLILFSMATNIQTVN